VGGEAASVNPLRKKRHKLRWKMKELGTQAALVETMGGWVLSAVSKGKETMGNCVMLHVKANQRRSTRA